MDENQLRLLLTPEGFEAVATARDLPLDSVREAGRAVQLLRARGYSPELTAVALTQAQLVRRGREKFGDVAASLLYTDAGLQQATRMRIAAVHAARYRYAGATEVVDLCCGMGADSLAFAAAGMTVTAIERDPVTAAIATYNLAPFPHTSVVLKDAQSVSLPAQAAIWADPARRSDAGRSYDPDDFTPPVDWVYSLAETHAVGMKLGPGHPHDQIPAECEAQWVSDHGVARELGLWFGPLARPGRRFSALVLTDDAAHEIDGDEHDPAVPTAALDRYLYDPDPAVIRARALGELSARLQAHTISPGIAYLSSAQCTSTPFADVFAVDEVLPFDRRRLRQLVHQRNIGSLEIKKRGADVDPAVLRRELRLHGDEHATLFVTRIAGRHRAIVAHRVTP